MFKTPFSKSLAAAAVATALGLASVSAQAISIFPDFKVDPTATGTGPTFTADKITGNYVEIITFGAGIFNISLLWQPTGFSYPEGQNNIAFTGLGSNFLMYATYLGSGTFTTDGTNSDFTLSPGGTFELYRDAITVPGTNTTFTNPANGSSPFGKVLGSDGVDMLLATGTGIEGEGKLACAVGLNCGSFGQVTSFALTANGKNFFVDPIPFYNLALTAGQFNGFLPVPGATLTLNGSLDAVFSEVPEPATVALLGLGLVGLGFSRRRTAA
jgi:hypothetical protein